MSTSPKITNISEEYVIQGLLKETMMLETEFRIDSEIINLKLIDLIESTIRESSEKKSLLFKTTPATSKTASLVEGQSYQVTTGFYRSQVAFHTRLISKENNDTLLFSIPSSLKMTNFRHGERAKVKIKFQRPFPLFIYTDGLHCEGAFIISDTSIEGFGGTLHVPIGFPVNSNTILFGEMIIEQGELKIHSKISRAIQLPQVKIDFDTYWVGTIQLKKKEDPKTDIKDRRKEQRLNIRHQITLLPLIHPDYEFAFELADISITGFSGNPATGSIFPNLPIGSTFTLKNTTTRAQLVHFNKERLHFNIISRNERDSVDWLRTMTPILHEGASCRVKDARDLYKIFLQAGAISTKYLKRYTFFESDLMTDQEGFCSEQGYLHRWYIKNSNGVVETHISAIRASNSGWILSDIGKVTGSDIDGERVVEAFFHSFSNLCNEMRPCPALMIAWTVDHPLWQAWKHHISKNWNIVGISNLLLSYHRISKDMLSHEHNTSNITYSEIKASNYREIKDIQESFHSEDILSFTKIMLDFDYSSFGSSVLNEICNSIFFRRYFTIKTEINRYLLVLTKYPTSKSINRVMDSIYVVPLGQTSISKNEIAEVNLLSYRLSLEVGLTSPAIRYVISQKQPLDTFDKSSLMQCYVLTPAGFTLFRGFK